TPVLGLLDRGAESLRDRLDLRLQLRHRLFGRLGWKDVDQFVLSNGAHVPPHGQWPPSQSRVARSGYSVSSCSSGRLKTFIVFANPSVTHDSTASAARAIAASI